MVATSQERWSPERSDRRRRAEKLVAETKGNEALLEGRRSRLIGRLHRASDDFAATEELQVVEAALSLIPRPEELRVRQG